MEQIKIEELIPFMRDGWVRWIKMVNGVGLNLNLHYCVKDLIFGLTVEDVRLIG